MSYTQSRLALRLMPMTVLRGDVIDDMAREAKKGDKVKDGYFLRRCQYFIALLPTTPFSSGLYYCYNAPAPLY